MFAVRMRLGHSVWVGASTDLYRRSARAHELQLSRRAQRTATTLIDRVRYRRWELWLPLQERRGLCQASDTRMPLNAPKVEDERLPLFFFARKHTVGKIESS